MPKSRRNSPRARPPRRRSKARANAGRSAPRTMYAPPAPAFVPTPTVKDKRGFKGGFSSGGIFAGSGGLLVVLLIVGKIALRGCSTYERQQRRERQNPDAVPAHVQEDPAEDDIEE